MREMKILKKLDHENVLKLIEIVTSKPTPANKNRGSVYLVFEFMDHDLNGLLDRKVKFEVPHIKCIMKQLLQGMAYLH